MKGDRKRKLVLPLVLAVTTAAAAVTTATTGCGTNNHPKLDAGHDGGPIDTPVV